MSTALRTVATPKASPGDDYIRQQDICTPWGLHYVAYQDTYYAPPAQPSRRSSHQPARKPSSTAS